MDNNGIPQCSFWYTQIDKDYLNNNYGIPDVATTIIELVRNHLAVMWNHKEDEDWGLILLILPSASPLRSTIDQIVEINDSQLYQQNQNVQYQRHHFYPTIDIMFSDNVIFHINPVSILILAFDIIGLINKSVKAAMIFSMHYQWKQLIQEIVVTWLLGDHNPINSLLFSPGYFS